MTLNGVIEKELKEMVSKVTPPGGKVAYLSTGVGTVIPDHEVLPGVENKTSDVEVTYIVPKKEGRRIKKMLLEPLPNQVVREIFSRSDKEDNDDSGTDQESDTDDLNTGNEDEEAKETGLTKDENHLHLLLNIIEL